jgi:hypothetical protein
MQIQNGDFDGWLKVQTASALKGYSLKSRYVLLKDFHLFLFPSDTPDARLLDMISVRLSSPPPLSQLGEEKKKEEESEWG